MPPDIASITRYDSHSSQYIESYDPQGGAVSGGAVSRTAALVHGGYWRNAYGADLMHPMAEHLVMGGWRVLNIEYRRVGDDISDGDHPNTWSAMRHDLEHALPTDTPLTLIGHSAGGHLAMWAAKSLTNHQIDGVIALAPVSDLIAASELALSNNAAGELLGESLEEARPDYLAASPRHLLPLTAPHLLVHGTADEAVPVEMSRDFVQAARQTTPEAIAYVEVEGLDHMALIDPADDVWRTIDAWLDR